MSIYAKLLRIQQELKAPKNQFNSFGKYNYRSCEDILEGVKPLLQETNTTLIIRDEIITVGERYYVKAIATLYECEGDGQIYSTAMAREEESKKGMDGSQVTGASSSYARKYALNGLFAIDDTKDADTKDGKDDDKPKSVLTDAQIKRAYAIAKTNNITEDALKQWIKTKFSKDSLKDLSKKEYDELCQALEKPNKQ